MAKDSGGRDPSIRRGWPGESTPTIPVQGARAGDHLCSFFESDHEERRLAVAFVRSGLAAGDRVLYLAERRDPDDVAAMLGAGGLDPGRFLASGQLAIISAAQLSPPGIGAPRRGGEELRGAADRARSQGYPGLRVSAEMGWARDRPDPERLREHESAMSAAALERGVVGLCQYDCRRLERTALGAVRELHTALAGDDGSEPLIALAGSRDPWGLEVLGTLDFCTAPAFARALRARIARPPGEMARSPGEIRAPDRVEIDLAGLSFIDVAGLRALDTVAGELEPDQRIVLVNAPARLARLVDLVGWRHPRVSLTR